MRLYNTKDFLKTVLSLHKTDTLKLLFPTMLLVGLYSYGIAYLEIEDPFNNDVNDIPMETLAQNIGKNVNLIFKK